MTQEQLEAVVAGVTEATAEHLDVVLSALVARVKALEERTPERGEKGDPGKDAPPVDLRALAEAAAALVPTPKDGKDGVDGKDGEPGRDAVVDIEAIVAAAVARIPTPKDGKDGEKGKDAVVDIDQIAGLVLAKAENLIAAAVSARLEAAVADAVAKAVAAIPRPKDGKDGADGVGLAGALIDKDGQLVVTLSDGRLQPLGRVVGEKGEPGQNGTNGRDGLGFEDLTFEQDERGRVYAAYAREGCETKRQRLSGAYCGVFTDGESYRKWDTVTWGGSMFIALKDTTAKPSEAGGDWQLCVKRGREGRQGTKGDTGDRGPKGDKGDPGPTRW